MLQQAESVPWSMYWPLLMRLEWALESCCSTGPSGHFANCCYVVPIVDCLSQATRLWWGWISSEQGAVVEVEAFVQRRSQERRLAAGRESLEDSLGAFEQVVHFQVPRHETCVAKLSWISEIRLLVYAASFPQGRQFHLESRLAQYPILLVVDMLMWSEISSVQHLSEEFLHRQHHDHCQWRP